MRILAAAIAAVFAIPAWAQNAVPVTVKNFPRAESDLYMGNAVKDGGFGKFHHNRTPTEIDKQLVIRMNRDTLYSAAVFDLDAGPVTITLPKAGKRFMSLQAISESLRPPFVIYGHPLSLTLTKENVWHAPCDGCRPHIGRSERSKRPEGSPCAAGRNQGQPEERRQIRGAELGSGFAEEGARCAAGSGSTTSGFKNAFGPKGQVDPINHLIGTAMGWGGNPSKDATYVSFHPGQKRRHDGLQAPRSRMCR